MDGGFIESDGAWKRQAFANLANGLPKIDAILGVDDSVATGFGDHIIVRYGLGVKESLGEKRVDGTAPRMTVFRRRGDNWLVAAHANFAPLMN